MEEVYEIIFSSPELKTLADYTNDPGSAASYYKDKEEEFLRIKNKQGKTNKQAILDRFKQQELRDKYATLPAKDMPLKIGTVLAILTQNIDKIGLLTQGIEVVSNDIAAFKARALAELESQEGYNPTRKIPIKDALNTGSLSELYPEMTVWVWCRALSTNSLSSENTGEIFNITQFVQKVSTNVGKNGGNFEITVPPLACEYDSQNNKWLIKKASLTQYNKNASNLTMDGAGYVASTEMLCQDEDGEVRRSQFLFHNILSSNDLVFIRFETLNIESEQRVQDNEGFIIDKSMLPGRIYDMIGLIDENNQAVDGVGSDVDTQIRGRDLSKLFIDDGTYFYALEMTQGQLKFAGGSTAKNSLIQRVFSEASLNYFGLYYNNSIENALKFVIQQLSSIKIVPDSLFEYYGDKRSYRFSPQKEGESRVKAIGDECESLKRRGVEYIRATRATQLLTETLNAEETKKCDQIWRDTYSFFSAIRRNKARRSAGSTTTGWSSFVYEAGGFEQIEVNTLPAAFGINLHMTLFASNILFTTVDQYIDLRTSNAPQKDTWEKEFASGIWQIIKLVIDEGVTERRIVDSSASSSSGSLLNFIRKICQEPFVEFYMDTYGDAYHLIVRKPPTDRKSIISMLRGQVSTEGDVGEEKITSTVIDIEIGDVLNETLSYDDAGVSSWYQLTPQANFIGNASTYSLAYLPAIFFEEYADIWGSRPMQIAHNYMPRLPLNASKTLLDVSEKQAFEDMRYIIESNAYLPFTRKGSITINGDRRMKIGNIVRYKATGEIFFIDHVQQLYSVSEGSIDRTTTLEVSRGMVESLILDAPVEGAKVPFSYFDIINTTLKIEEAQQQSDVTRAQVFSNFRVFKECFNFFIRRGQNDIKQLGKVNNNSNI